MSNGNVLLPLIWTETQAQLSLYVLPILHKVLTVKTPTWVKSELKAKININAPWCRLEYAQREAKGPVCRIYGFGKSFVTPESKAVNRFQEFCGRIQTSEAKLIER